MTRPTNPSNKLENPKNISFKKLAYNRIKEMILLREIVYGEKIFEKDIAEKLQMSRTPVREALLILESENFVENLDRLGFVVRRPKIEEIKDYFDIRDVLETYAAPRIVANISDQDTDALKENVRQAERHLVAGDSRNFILCNGHFHELLANVTHSAIYCRLVANLNDISTLLRATSFGSKDGLQDSLAGHKKILAVLQSGDAGALKAVLAEHLTQIRTKIEHFVFM